MLSKCKKNTIFKNLLLELAIMLNVQEFFAKNMQYIPEKLHNLHDQNA
jgi:hypothetical protein